MTLDWTRLNNKVRFITEIIDGKLVVQNRKKTDLLQELIKRDYKPFPKTASKSAVTADNDDENAAEDDGATSGGYDYLLSMQIWSLTAEKVNILKEDRAKK